VIGFKERRRNQAAEFEPGDEIAFYVTGVQAFGAIARVRSRMFEDRRPIWPQGEKKHPEDYPWRVIGELEHARKWPAEHWPLAFQGQLRIVSEADAGLLRERIEARARAAAPAG
jgi:hypothetical protein